MKGLKPLGPLHVSRRRRIREPNGTFAGLRLGIFSNRRLVTSGIVCSRALITDGLGLGEVGDEIQCCDQTTQNVKWQFFFRLTFLSDGKVIGTFAAGTGVRRSTATDELGFGSTPLEGA